MHSPANSFGKSFARQGWKRPLSPTARKRPRVCEQTSFMPIRLRRRVSIDSPQASLNGNTLDLSLGGMLLQAERTFPPGTLVTVNLEIEPGLAPLRSAARIVRVIGTDCMGIQFETLGPEESDRLQQFLLPLILAAT